MRKLINLVLGLILLLGLISCGGNKEVVEVKKETEQQVLKVYQPDWYDIQDDEEVIYFFGEAEKKNQNMAYEAALANARIRSAEYVEVHVRGMIKNYMEEVGVEDPTITALTSQTVKKCFQCKVFWYTSIQKGNCGFG